MVRIRAHRRRTKRGTTSVVKHERRTPFKYGKEDLGVYIDGAHGEHHAFARMAELVEPFDKKLAKELNDMYDAAMDDPAALDDSALNDGTDVLQKHTKKGYVWWWDSGDLILMDEKEMD